MAEIPAFVIEYFLLGRTHRDAIERYTQDAGIVTDVWLAFARDQTKPQRVLIAPTVNTSSVVLGHLLHNAISLYRHNTAQLLERILPTVSPLENFVAVTLYFDELLRIVLPLTTFSNRKYLNALRKKAEKSGPSLEGKLEQAILYRLRSLDGEMAFRHEDSSTDGPIVDNKVMESAPQAALIGVFRMAQEDPISIDNLRGLDPRRPEDADRFLGWIEDHAGQIARAAREELSSELEPALLREDAVDRSQLPRTTTSGEPPELILRVFLDRKVSLADTVGNCTIKADAANRVFGISCKGITWAIIDSGIVASHPAFLDHDARDNRGRRIEPPPSRIKATLDFTCIERIRNFDLTAYPEGSPERSNAIDGVVAELSNLPGRSFNPNFAAEAKQRLEAIARQLEARIPPDWNLIEPLITLGNEDDGSRLVSDHGTHVAGILGADWRETNTTTGTQEIRLQGVCPDISIYDLRVVNRDSAKRTEFAVVASLEYVQFVNSRAASNGPIIHGVNLSLSIPHEVRNYGCGATPVCAACDRLVNSGVVVVAAAGNRGWNEMEIGFGNFVFCSITDPGNAREVITVGATHPTKPHQYGVSYFSSRGPTGDGRVKPDLVAPGEKIRSSIRGNMDAELDGTSMAAPFVCGAAAMLIARNKELSGNPARVKQILCDSATDLGREKYFQGHGMVDVLRAMQSV
jgi:serine protease AprX